MRKRAACLVLALAALPAGVAASEAAPLAACTALAQATSLTWDDPGEECSDFFILTEPATVIVRLDAEGFTGTLGAALVEHETVVATFKQSFVAGRPIDGPAEMEAALGPGNWRLRAFAGVTPRQPCAPVPELIPGLVPSCGLVPGVGLGTYAASVLAA